MCPRRKENESKFDVIYRSHLHVSKPIRTDNFLLRSEMYPLSELQWIRFVCNCYDTTVHENNYRI